MKKALILIATTLIGLSLCACGQDKVPEGGATANIEISLSDDKVPILSNGIVIENGYKTAISPEQFDDYVLIKINDEYFAVGTSTPNDIATAIGLQAVYNSNFGCYEFRNKGIVCILAYTEDGKNPDSVIEKMTITNLASNNNTISFSYNGITNGSNSSDADSKLGSATTYADSDKVKNHIWGYVDSSSNKYIEYQMIWYDGQLTEIQLSVK